MEKNQATVSLFLDTRSTKKNGKHPLKLTVYYNPEKKRYKTKIDLTEEDWKKLRSGNLRDQDLKNTKLKINALIAEADDIIQTLKPFTFYGFEKQFFQNNVELSDLSLLNLFKNYIAKHEKKGSVGTAISYQTAINSIESFRKNLSLYDITPEFLQEYESFMKENGKSTSTIGIYLRQLRAVVNEAISMKLMSRDDYPFGKSKFIIPVGNNFKKALSREEITALVNYSPVDKDQKRALDFWILSYLSNGMNFCDILRLRPQDISGEFICYIRSKTKNTKKGTNQLIKVPILPRAKQIINRWRASNLKSYLFPFLKPDSTAIQEKYMIQDFIKDTNKLMEIIRQDLGISQKCNTYSCRHSFATMMKRQNVSIEFISESLGHATTSTTTAYLASFEDETKLQFAKLLLG